MEIYTILCTFCVSLVGAYTIIKYPSVFVAEGGRHVTAKQSAWRFETPRSGGIALCSVSHLHLLLPKIKQLSLY